LLLAIPLLVAGAVGYVALSGSGDGERLALAPGTSLGSFHPVAGGFEPDDTALEDCKGSYSCLWQAFGNVAYYSGPKAALALFDREIARDERVRADCHRIAHTIGSAALARNEGSVARTFAQGGATCASGYYHGVLERAFSGATTRAQLVSRARSICAGAGLRRRSFLDYQCVHGLGHGLMIQTGYQLPVALSLCSKLQTPWDDVTCTGGVFMENVNTRFGFKSRWVEDDDPLYPCNVVATRYRSSCYLRASQRVLELNRSNWQETTATCKSVDDRWTRFCFRGYGRGAVGEAQYDARKVVRLCALAGEGEGDCYFGAARTVADGSGRNGVRRAAALCRSAPASRQAACFSGLGVVIGLLQPTPEARAKACAEVTRLHAASCTAAAAAEVDPNARQIWG
jgi:hypothetical protein